MRVSIVCAVVLLVVVIFFLGKSEEREAALAAPTPSKYDQRLIELDREAVEEAYRRTIEHLFQTLVRTSITHPSEPVMVGRGAAIARKTYIDAMTAIDDREQRQRR